MSYKLVIFVLGQAPTTARLITRSFVGRIHGHIVTSRARGGCEQNFGLHYIISANVFWVRGNLFTTGSTCGRTGGYIPFLFLGTGTLRPWTNCWRGSQRIQRDQTFSAMLGSIQGCCHHLQRLEKSTRQTVECGKQSASPKLFYFPNTY